MNGPDRSVSPPFVEIQSHRKVPKRLEGSEGEGEVEAQERRRDKESTHRLGAVSFFLVHDDGPPSKNGRGHGDNVDVRVRRRINAPR